MKGISWKGWLALLGVWGVMAVLGTRMLDSDFGWHYRLGEIITKSGIPVTDPFSYTMPSYPFVDYEWGTDVVWYRLYPILGMAGLAIVYAAIAIVAPLIAMPKLKAEYKLWLAALVWTVMIFRFGVRAQVISWLFTAIITRWIFDIQLWRKERKWYPWLLLVWANMHGSYILGVGAVGIGLGIRAIEERAVDVKDWLFWGTGVAVTLVNPYGVRNWWEVVRQIGQAGLNSKAIGEWEPFYAKVDLAMWAMIILAVIGWRQDRKKPGRIAEAIVGLTFLAGAVLGLRHTPLFMIAALPLAARGVAWVEQTAVRDKESLVRWGKFKMIMLGVVGLGLAGELALAFYQAGDYVDRLFPVAAVEFLQSYKIPGRIFNRYGWGGYLIWKMPGQRFFIDGRMSNFYWQAPKGESNQAFLEYLNIKWGKVRAEEIFRKYGVGTILWNATRQPGEVDLVKNLTTDGWRTVYKDKTAVVLIKPEEI